MTQSKAYKLPLKFEDIHPSRGHDYTEHPIIKEYLEETTLDPLINKGLRKDFCCSSAMIFHINESKTWFGHGKFNCFYAAQVEDFFQSEEITLCRTMMLGKASLITYGCSLPESAALPMPLLLHALAQNSVQRK